MLCISSQIASIEQTEAFRTVSYAMSKAALNMAVKRLHAALGDDGVTVLALHPGWLATRIGGPKATLDPADSARAIIAMTDAVHPGDGGRFLGRDGSPLPW